MPRMVSRLTDRACCHLSWAVQGKQSGERQRYVVGVEYRGKKRALFPVTRVKWPARSTMAAGGSGAERINRMAWAWHRIPPVSYCA